MFGCVLKLLDGSDVMVLCVLGMLKVYYVLCMLFVLLLFDVFELLFVVV